MSEIPNNDLWGFAISFGIIMFIIIYFAVKAHKKPEPVSRWSIRHDLSYYNDKYTIQSYLYEFIGDEIKVRGSQESKQVNPIVLRDEMKRHKDKLNDVIKHLEPINEIHEF